MQVQLFIRCFIVLLFSVGIIQHLVGNVVTAQAGHVPIEPTEIEITPEIPTVEESVQIVVQGTWSDGCVPRYVSHAIEATQITIVTTTPSPDTPCFAAITPWAISIDVDMLSPADYTIDVEGATTASTTLRVVGQRIYLPWIGN